MRRPLTLLVPALLLAAVSSACHHHARIDPGPAVVDSVRGIVSITGTELDQHIVIRSASVVNAITADAADSAALSRMGGIEVLVVGRRSSGQIHVDHFTALTVGGASVVDGVLRANGGRLQLETAKGTIPLGNPPAALRNLVAARVWIGGPLDTGPNTYGVISPPQSR